MPRKHLLPASSSCSPPPRSAGLLALATRRRRSAARQVRPTSEQPAIAFRIAQLDKAEKSLRSQLADLQKAPAAAARTVVRAAGAARRRARATREHEDDHG